METRNIFITGGLGFIGSNIAINLIRRNQDVTLATLSKRNMWRIRQNTDSFEIIELDVTNQNRVKDTLKLIRPDIIVHNSVFGAYHEKNQDKIFQVNLYGLINMINAYLETQADLFINTSTISEYGIKNSPFEETDLLNPLGDYAVSKAAATMFCESTRNLTKRNVITTRIANPYGPFEKPQDLIPYLILHRIKGQEVQLNSPYNVRDFIYIDDIVDAYWQIISSYEIITSSIFNIATGIETTIGKLVELVETIVPGNGPIQVKWNANEPRVKDVANHYSASIKRIYNELKWRPKFNMRDGIKKFYSWIQDIGLKDEEIKYIYDI